MQEQYGKTKNATVFYKNMKIKNNLPDWFRPKRYVHFSSKIENSDFLWVNKKIQNSEFVAKYQFYPLLKYEIKQRKYKNVKNKNGELERVNNSETVKRREIAFANHLDAHIFSYYAHNKLIPLYDEQLRKNNINESITGYRKIDSGRVKPKTNETIYKCSIDFAYDVFEHIRKFESCVAIAFDITNFFPSLDHSLLKASWTKL